MNIRPIFLLAAVLSAPLLLTACGGGSSASSNNGTLSVAMTDAPACGFDHVYVTVTQVRVNASASAGDGDGGWSSVVLNQPQKIDLLSLTNGVLTQLGQTPLPAGHYEQIRLVLAGNTSNTLTDSVVLSGTSTEQALATPSASQSGYKVVGSFDVQPNTLVDLVLDFDACHSIVQQGNGNYALKPVVKATTEVVSGSITGFVDPSEVGASVYAEQNGMIVKGTVADSTGKFVLSPVVQSSTNGNYDVVIEQVNHATGVVRSVPVTAGATTNVSTSAQPFLLGASTMHNAGGTVTPASALATIDALQSSGGGTFDIAFTNVNMDTGVYSLSLPAGAPLVGTYSTTLPITLNADETAAGAYTMKATDTTTGATQTSNINISASDANSVNFAF